MSAELDSPLSSYVKRQRLDAVVICGVLAIITSVVADDWIAGIAVCVLALGWRYLRSQEGPPVLALAFTHQWLQVTAGIFYYGFVGRRLPTMNDSDYRPVVLMGLVCLIATLIGLRTGMKLARRNEHPSQTKPLVAFTWRELLIGYLASTMLTGIIQVIAWQIPQLTQAILVLTYFRLALLFMLLRRLIHPTLKWKLFGLFLFFEIVIGMTGYFAGFRESLAMAALAILELFNYRRLRHWLVLAVLAVVTVLAGLIWTSIKTDYRRDFKSEAFAQSQTARLERLGQLASGFFDQDIDHLTETLDAMVDRIWAVYYPALAVSQVPSKIPHENGALLSRAVWHILTPRLFFPEKEELPSDSEMVRSYSGIMVAGREQGTSIAFGYAAESYIDFGAPLMFVPVFLFGLLMGLAYQLLLRAIRHRELAVGLVTVVFWLSLYLYERSWVMMLGLSGTIIFYLGGATILLDRVLLLRRRPAQSSLRTMLAAPSDRSPTQIISRGESVEPVNR